MAEICPPLVSDDYNDVSPWPQTQKLKIVKDNLSSDNLTPDEAKLYLAYIRSSLNRYGYDQIERMCEDNFPGLFAKFYECGDLDIEVRP